VSAVLSWRRHKQKNIFHSSRTERIQDLVTRSIEARRRRLHEFMFIFRSLVSPRTKANKYEAHTDLGVVAFSHSHTLVGPNAASSNRRFHRRLQLQLRTRILLRTLRRRPSGTPAGLQTLGPRQNPDRTQSRLSWSLSRMTS